MHAYRTHDCAALTRAEVGQAVRLSGWVHRIRDHGGILFIDLRDHYGVTQLLCDPDSPAFAAVEALRPETCIRIDGTVKARAPELVNPRLATGAIEVFVSALETLGPAGDLPLQVFGEQDYPEETRLKYRFLDLRRDKLHANMMLRSAVVRSLRQRMWDRGFTEFQTPIITASSPEGARDFLVPSRLHPGRFYALPQAPQQFKQLLMVSGFDRYFQIAPCFRDEDPRADRSPTDFYQLDVEMSFVTQEDVFAAVEPVIRGTFEEFGGGRKVDADWPRLSWDQAALWYGTDKPDLRCPLKMERVSEHFRGSGFKVFASLLEQPGTEVRAIPAPNGGSRAFCDRMNAFAQKEGLPGMGYIFWRERFTEKRDEIRQLITKTEQSGKEAPRLRDLINSLKDENARSKLLRYLALRDEGDGVGAWGVAERLYQELEGAGPIAKNIGVERVEAIRKQLKLRHGDAVFFLGGKPADFEKVAAKARVELGRELGHFDEDRFAFCWIVDFPMYEKTDEGVIDFSHNPFSMPQGGLAALSGDPLSVKGHQYDLACNGYELVSGAIRNHAPEIMFRAFEIAGYPASEVEARFGGMLNAFRYGAPPHGGCAMGIDRAVMLLADESNIREVILFPMNQRAEDLMMGAPSAPSNQQLRELGLRLAPKEG